MRLSLLKAATSPDAHQDEGKHTFAFALYPHPNAFVDSDVVQAARIFNDPLVGAPGGVESRATACITLEGASSVVLDTIKRAEQDFGYQGVQSKGTRAVVCRLYEVGRVTFPDPYLSTKRQTTAKETDHRQLSTCYDFFRFFFRFFFSLVVWSPLPHSDSLSADTLPYSSRRKFPSFPGLCASNVPQLLPPPNLADLPSPSHHLASQHAPNLAHRILQHPRR